MNEIEKAISDIKTKECGSGYFDGNFIARLIDTLNKLKAQTIITDYSFQVEPKSYEISYTPQGQAKPLRLCNVVIDDLTPEQIEELFSDD
jgi:hypothetical protein